MSGTESKLNKTPNSTSTANQRMSLLRAKSEKIIDKLKKALKFEMQRRLELEMQQHKNNSGGHDGSHSNSGFKRG